MWWRDDPKAYAEHLRICRNFRRRLQRDPGRFSFWSGGMPDDESRHCVTCGTLFRPDSGRIREEPIAPPSVARRHTRAYCSKHCMAPVFAPIPSDLAFIDPVLSGSRIREAVFNRDNWHCYLCGRPTPSETKDLQQQATIDHIVPRGVGTDHPDNLRCACRRCNVVKGGDTTWLRIHMRTLSGSRYNAWQALDLLPRMPTAEELQVLWRHYWYNGDKEVDADEAHPILSAIPHFLDFSGQPITRVVAPLRTVIRFTDAGVVIEDHLSDGSFVRRQVRPKPTD
jgi:hypothetical protein